MATYSKELFSETTNGEAIDISATNSPGTVVHNSVDSSGSLDEIWVWVSNRDATKSNIVVEFGGTAEGNRIVEEVDPYKTVLIIPGIPLISGATVRIYSASGNTTAFGYVNRRSP